ncbi:restriction endonuclease subunit S, partial [Gallibacterium salpingitidis]|uniref:restriction endonuclease subunit S n=1 Tax=Gallibacterium salpingitidis TaxID=505341 RepID=UPI000A4782E2
MKINKIPKLRFPEFTDDWEQCRLGDMVYRELKGKAYANQLGDGNVEYLDANRLNDGKVFLSNGIQNVSKKDILIIWDGSNAGKIFSGFSGVLGSTLKAYTLHKNYSHLFIYQALLKDQELIFKKFRTPNIPHVVKNFTDIFEITIPPLPEQQKIGSFFQQLDQLITLHKRKYENSISLKKSLLQKMFPKNGQSVPEIRFPEFTDAWEQC